MPGILGTASAASHKSPGARYAIGLALLVGLSFHLGFIARAMFVLDGERSFSLFDDAMVSLTYARNLAAGHGLVWMPGEPPVEGYTNLLWTLLIACGLDLGFDAISANRVLSLLSGAMLLAASHSISKSLVGCLDDTIFLTVCCLV